MPGKELKSRKPDIKILILKIAFNVTFFFFLTNSAEKET